jgi:hypothetical protein
MFFKPRISRHLRRQGNVTSSGDATNELFEKSRWGWQVSSLCFGPEVRLSPGTGPDKMLQRQMYCHSFKNI